jgi:NADPH2:quinone reductase
MCSLPGIAPVKATPAPSVKATPAKNGYTIGMTVTIPEMMQQIVVNAPGGPEMMELATRLTPKAGDGELLIQVAAAGVNRPDVSQRQGQYPPPPGASPTLGLEVSGTVAAIGAGAEEWQVGDAVCALVNGGGYAEYCVAPVCQCLSIPKALSFTEAAAVPETFFTVWANVFDRAHLISGETLLIHGGSSGIGTTAIQLGRALGARVFVTVGSAKKAEACLHLGAEAAINYHESDFVTEIQRLTDGRGVDVILDMVGGSYLPRNLSVLALDGRLAQIAFLEGSRVEVDLRVLLSKRLTVTGSTLRPRTASEKAQIAQALKTHVWPLLASGQVRPLIDHTYSLAEAAVAHTRMEEGDHIGKIVLTVADALR